jgi:NADPH2:quinone reductase
LPKTLGASFFSPTTSAWVALHEVAKLQAGEQVLVTGASGAVGSLTMQLARDAGCAVTRVDPNAESPATASADLLIDTVGGNVLATALPAVRPGGRAVLIGYTAGSTLQLDIAHFLQRDVSLLPLNMFRREAAGRAAAPELLARLADGRLHLDVQSFALADAAIALEWIAQRGHRGRAVLVP